MEMSAKVNGIAFQLEKFDFLFGVMLGENILQLADNLSRVWVLCVHVKELAHQCLPLLLCFGSPSKTFGMCHHFSYLIEHHKSDRQQHSLLMQTALFFSEG